MDNQQSSASYLVGATQFPNPLAAALHAVTERVQRRAELAGLPAVIVGARFTQPADNGGAHLSFSLTAAMKGQQWHEAPVMADGYSLEAAEAAFNRKLEDFELEAYEADPCRFADAQIESYQALEAAGW